MRKMLLAEFVLAAAASYGLESEAPLRFPRVALGMATQGNKQFPVEITDNL